MKKLVISFSIILFSVLTVPVYAEYSSTAYGGTTDETFLTRTSDWLATVGKSREEKYRIKKERRAMRKIYRAKKKIQKRQKEAAKKKRAYRK